MDSLRIDKWLWAARWFKTRALARQAVDGGKVHVNGVRVKPSKLLRSGDHLRLMRGQDEYKLIVAAISPRRGPASVAQELYLETAADKKKREDLEALRRLQYHANRTGPERRPDKRQRRQIRSFKEKSGPE